MIDTITALSLATVLITRSRETPDGHRVWTGDTKGRILRDGANYTYRQAAHIIRTGYPAQGTVRTTCGVTACFLHITDAGTIPGPPAAPDPQWHKRAACRAHDTNQWYPEDTDDPATAQASAVGICAACPVRAHCLADALAEEGGISDQGRHGIRGGLTGRQRHREYQRLAAARKAAV